MAAFDAGSASSDVPETENCSEIRLLLSAYVDNEATPEEAARAKSHIIVCASCASHLAFLRLTGRALSQSPEVFPSASLSARIAAATYDRPTLGERIAGWLRPAPVRVGLGAALAAGLAMVLIMPRIGEINTVDLPFAPENGLSTPKSKSPAAAKAGSTGTALPKSAVKTAKTVEVPKTVAVKAVPMKAPAAKPVAASVLPSTPAPAVSVKKPNVVVAKAARRRTLESLVPTGSDLLSAGDILREARAEPRIDRNSPLRSAANISLKRPGGAEVTIPRSNYNRTAATENILKAREAATAASVASSLPTPASGISPLLSENTAITERAAPRSPVASAVVPVAAAVESQLQRPILYRVSHQRNRGVESFSTAGLRRGNNGMPSATGRDSSFGFSPAVKAGIVEAPVTGMD